MENICPPKERYTWDYYHTLVSELSKEITPVPNIIVGIGKGGLIPGVILAEKYQCTLLNFGLRSYSNYTGGKVEQYQSLDCYPVLQDANVLVVDDIADSGNTFKYAVNSFKVQCCERVKTAAVFYKPKSSFKPDFFARETSNDVWIVQPWETE